MGASERLKMVLDDSGMNLKDFSIKVGLPYRTVQNYLHRENSISAAALEALYTNLGININWLLMGEGEMYRGQGGGALPNGVLFINARTGKPVTAQDFREILKSMKTHLNRAQQEVDYAEELLNTKET